MTIDEAVERYKNNAEYERTHGNLQGCLDFRQLAEWLKDYKRLKEQEPCEDAISRELLLRDLLLKAQGEKDVSIKWLEEYINSLPSVTPKGVTVTDFADRCRECGREKVLDKIRVEIEELEEGITSYHNDRPWIYKDEVLAIIDKYKAKSEVRSR